MYDVSLSLSFEPSTTSLTERRTQQLRPTQSELVELRASQRTFEGAYFRTSLSLFSFSLLVLKIFTQEFYPIGVLFSCYGVLVMFIAAFRRQEGNRQFFLKRE